MKRRMFLFMILLLALSACSAQPAATLQPTNQEQPPADITTSTSAPEQTSQPMETVTPAIEALTLKIVPGESKVSYEVGETFLNQNDRFNLAVGVTTTVNGEIQVNPSDPSASTLGEISMDISQFTSDSSRRDNAIRNDWLESANFPIATFKPTGIENLPSTYQPGSELTFRVTGDLTVKETTRPVTFDVTASLAGDVLTGKATTTILMSEFGVGPISILGVLTTEDEAKLTLEFVARP